jgi:indole-3-glycerol phosphate synthase
MANILEEIVEQTKIDLKKRKRKVSFNDLGDMELFEQSPRDFGAALQLEDDVAIIAEIKKASPSKGLIRPNFDPQKIAGQYQEGGASAISVLTDKPAFRGSLEYLEIVSREVELPVLRKDFIVDPYQVKEAKSYGADAVLLIATIMEGSQLDELLHATNEFGLQALVECYSEEDIEYVNFEHTDILGVNNRDLRSFEVNLHCGIELLHKAPEDTVLVSESGLGTPEDLKLLYDEDINAVLIGEYFMRQQDPGEAVKEMKSKLNNLITKEGKE